MGKIDSYRIELDSPLAIYFPGQTVTGKVILELNQEIKWKGIFIQVKGEAYVHWSERQKFHDRRSNRTEYRTVYVKDRQIYFNIQKDVRELTPGDNDETIGPGRMQYPFTIPLPPNIPGSFEGKHGYIRYTCSSHISRPWKFDPKCKMGFTVLELVDLNLTQGVTAQGNGENYRNTGCYCYKTGSISASVSLNKTGFVPGENIIIRANVKNNSNVEIKRTTADLVCLATYVAGSFIRRDPVKICNVDGSSIPPHNNDEWTDKALKIPPIPPSRSLTLCRLVGLEYYLQFKVDPSGLLNGDLDVIVPITIGSIPLQTDFQLFAPMGYSDNSIGIKNPQISFPPNGVSAYPDIPLPTYEECVSGKADIREEDDGHTSGDLTFAPRYMYYKQKNPSVPTICSPY